MVPVRYTALATVAVALSIGGGVAYAAQGSPTTTTPSTTKPSTTAPRSSNCPNMGTNSGSSSSGASFTPSSNV